MKTSHKEIFQCLKREILAGRYEANGRFPTASELAERFGVSRPTICRAMLDLKNEGLVLTRCGAAPRLTPYAEHATGTFAVLHPGFRYGGVLDEIFTNLVRLAGEDGWDIVVRELHGNNPENRAQEICRHVKSFLAERVSGLFLQPFDYLIKGHEEKLQMKLGETLSSCSMPIVLLDYDFARAPLRSAYDLVAMNNQIAGYKIGKKLLADGAENIAFLLRPGSAPSVEDRMRGVANAVIESGKSWSLANNVMNCGTEQKRKILRFLRKHATDAIVCGNDVTALELLNVIEGGNLNRKTRIAGFDGDPAAYAKGILSIRQPTREIAALALAQMKLRLKTPSLPVQTILADDNGFYR